MTKTCPLCGDKLMIAYEQLGRGQPYYLAVCAGLMSCRTVPLGVSGKGDTEQAAIDDFHAKATAANQPREQQLI